MAGLMCRFTPSGNITGNNEGSIDIGRIFKQHAAASIHKAATTRRWLYYWT
jgi:hypothetical protein